MKPLRLIIFKRVHKMNIGTVNILAHTQFHGIFKKASEFDQEIPQSHTEDKPIAS